MVIIQKLYPEVIKMCRPFIVEDEVLKLIGKKFSESVGKSLNAEHADTSPLKCGLTHVTDFPDGTEKGSYIGLDFSGRIFRLAYVGLKGDRSFVTFSKLYEFPDQKLSANISKLMDYVARCVNNFIETYDIYDKKTILGVASGFPMEQDCLQEGKVLEWGKDFQSGDLIDQDLFMQLKVSLKKFKYTKGIYLISLVSNSTACLLSGLYRDPGMRIGLYLGDETNITYVEKFKNMTVHAGDGLRTRTALTVEMKSFGDGGILDFVRTEFDFNVDAASANPGKFVLEKMVSATYLGEIARLCLYKLASLGIILNGHATPALSMKDGLKTSDMAMMEMDEENKFLRCKAVMRNLGYREVSNEDCTQIRFVCRCVARRSCNLVAACLAGLLQRMESRDVHIIGDGSLLKDFANYEHYLVKKMNQLKRPEIRFCIKKGDKEEVAIGAGMVALIYKDETMKLEDKHRALPPFNPTKYNLPDLPASCIDCDCEPDRPRAVRKESKIVEIVSPVPGTPIACDSRPQIFDFAEPVFATSLEVNS